MSDMRVESLLSQIRSIREQTSFKPMQGPEGLEVGRAGNIGPVGDVAPQQRVDFGSMLKQSIDSVNEMQSRSSQTAAAYERGDKNVTLTEVMVNSQKSDVALKAVVEVRNKFVDAYQEIMRMSI